MNVILYLEVTSNGFIAKPNNDTSWVSKEASNSYTRTMREMDAIIIGKKTYHIMPEDEFQSTVQYVVISHQPNSKPKVPNVQFVNKSPNEVLLMLKQQNHKRVCISGGSQINTLFMKAGLINEIYLDVEPVVFGKGIPLFSPDEFEYSLKLLEVKKLNQNTVQLHYAVQK